MSETPNTRPMTTTDPVSEWRVGRSVAVGAPASSANLGPGFDSIGLALAVRDEYSVSVTATPGLQVELHGEGAQGLRRDESHLVARTLKQGLALSGVGWLPELATHGLGLRLDCYNVIPMSAGMGSSATAIVGGLSLGFALAGDGELTEAERSLINTHAGLWEGHPDNSSASVYGGMTVSWQPSADVVRTAQLQVHPQIEPVVLVPSGDRLSTSTARAALAPLVNHGDAVRQAGRSALLVHAMTQDPDLLWDATCDWLHQEPRRAAYPASMAAVDALRGLGHAAVISGAGPTVLALVRSDVADAVQAEVRSWGRSWKVLRPGIDTAGVVAAKAN
ncbi:homoserine kinase [Ornithinimicrobium sp. INDO-MA30-4]|uniref:homoserine kinase n=1 Tax=Ornithinimicrobium sp. INDO-MA30-4 TaxID=2908651 RepID=UPI001F36E62F|nr:homoserine kinase [Ornithinimicrobium sp. INDO-MA30-4]UJH70680.1 homoserine kinase [Ornithinimicrobium sp. INDO-MA30-4]